MKKIFLIFTLFVSSYVFNEQRRFSDHVRDDSIDNLYEVCSDTNLGALIICVNVFIESGYKPQSGLHAVDTPKGTLFFQSVIKK